jgi:hypothetical protein
LLLQSLTDVKILQYIDLLVDNNHKLTSYATAVAKQWLCKNGFCQVMAINSSREIMFSMQSKLQPRDATTETLFSVQSMPRLNNKGQLPLELFFYGSQKSRRLIVRHSPAGKNVGMEAEDPSLGNDRRGLTLV